MTALQFAHKIVQIRFFFLSLPLPPPFCGGGSRAATIAWEPSPVSFNAGIDYKENLAHLVENVLQLVLRECRTFNILDGT